MKKTTLKVLKGATVSAFFAALALGAVINLPASASAESVVDANGLFVNGSGVTVQKAAAAPDTFESYKGEEISRDFDIGKEGVLLSATDVGSTIELSPTFAGDFSMSFRAYSDTSFGSDNAAEYNASAYAITPYADLREIAFRFEDEKGQSFTVYISGGEKYNVITPSARVAIGEVEIGYHYANDSTSPNDTALKNLGGYYTRIGGTTFCNVARRNSTNTSAESMPITFGYNAEEMQIYVIHYGTLTTTEEYRVVLDLDDESTGLRAFKSFENYKVSVEFTGIASGRDANVIVYDVNGQSLAGETFADTLGAETLVKKEYEGVKGQKYYLPAPEAFDLLDGKLAFDGSVSVSGNTTVYDGAGNPTDIWSEGCYFLPTKTGTYAVTYKAKDTKGNYGTEKVISVKVYDSFPETEFSFAGNYTALATEDVVYGVGSSFSLYAATASGELLLSDGAKQVYVTLLKDGEIYGGVDKLPADTAREVALDSAGTYTLLYNTEAYAADIVKEYSFTVSASAPKYTLSAALPEKVAVGSSFTLPKLTAEQNGSKKLASTVLYAPDGSLVTVTGGVAEIEQVGEYKLSYTVRMDATYVYTVYFDAYHTNGNAFISENVSAVTVELGDSGNLYPNTASGVVITYSSENVWARYSKVIDLSKNTADDPFVKIMVLPSSVGALDYWQYTVRLTDIYNEKNYIDIEVFKGSWGNAYSYVKAGSADQTPSGWEMNSVLTAYNTGCPINYSFTGESLLGTENAVFYYDYADQALYVDNIKRTGYSYGNQVIDFDSAKCFSESSLFKGFTTGEVYMSISVQYLQGDYAKLMVTEAGGVSLGDAWIDDTTAPRIGVDYGAYTENSIPVGMVNVAYPIFAADAFDSVDGKLDVSVKVFKDYQTSNQTEIAVTEGKFLPTSAGLYTISYKATDKSGNVCEKTALVTVENELPDFAYAFEKTLKTAYVLGEYLELPSGTASGGSGNVTATLRVLAPSGATVDAKGYVVEEEGTYTLEITFEDFLGRTDTRTYELQATVSEKPVVYGVTMYKAMVNGATYVLPDFEAVDYSTGSYQAPDKEIFVTYNGETTVLGEDRTYVPAVANHQDVIEVVYRATNANGQKTELRYEVAVLVTQDGGGIDMSGYFRLVNATAGEKTASYVEFETQTDGASLSFVNPLIANNLQFELYVPAAKNNFSSFTVTYTDSQDESVTQSMTILKHTASYNYSYFVSGGEKVQIYGNFFDKTSYGFSVKFNNNSLYFYDSNANANLVKGTQTDAGEAFGGFPSGKVYVTVTFNGVTGASAIRVMQLGNQYFSNLSGDRVAPQMQLSAFLERSAEINEPFTVPSAIAADVLNPEVTLTVTVKYGSQTIYSGAIDEDYVFTPTNYGKYSVTYEAVAGGRKASSTYPVMVKDRIKPTVTLNGNVPTTCKAGTTLKLPAAVAEDNNSSGMRVWIFITKPNGRMVTLAEGETTYVPDEKGVYKISYYVEDEYANYAYAQYTVTVS